MMIVHYVPIVTTIFSVFFLKEIGSHYLQKKHALYLLWWSVGVLTYGLGTLSESINTIFGWSDLNFRLWYIAGALLGGFPLAQGTVYLLLKKKTANILTILFVTIIGIAALFVLLSPLDTTMASDGRLTGQVLGWRWVRYFSPFINVYSFIFLFGGAIYSAIQYKRMTSSDKRFLGNIFIAIGALLPGIGGTFTRFGHVEVLYITELFGLIAMYTGYNLMKKDPSVSVHQQQQHVDKM